MKSYEISYTDDTNCENIEKVYKYEFYLGENSNENWKLLNKSKKWYYFFHLTDFPSGYGMLICEEGEDIPMDVIKQCGKHVLNKTKQKNRVNIRVDYTTYGNLKRGNKEGEVLFKKSNKVKVVYIP